MTLRQNLKKYIKRYLGPTTVAGFLGLGVYGDAVHSRRINELKEKAKTEQAVKDSLQQVSIPKIKNPILNVEYRTDTLEKAGSTLLFYSAGLITRYYVENNNSYRMQLPYFAHEEWHHHNDELRYRTRYYYTPTEYYKLCMHDEISANMAAVLTARYEYLAAPTRAEKKKIIDRYKKSYMKFYFDEVAAGRIKPESNNPADIEKERSLIANGTMKMWMEKYSRHYSPTTFRMLQRYVGRVGLVSNSKKNYKKILNHMYTIGGVNFADYFIQDIETKDDKVLLAEQLPKIRFMKAGGVEIMDIVNQNYPLMSEVGLDKQLEIFQHLLISSQLKYMLRNKTAEELEANPQLVNLCFRKVINSAYSDKSFHNAVHNFPLFSVDRCKLNARDKNLDKTAQKMYTFRGLDLTSMIADFSVQRVPIKSYFDNIFDNVNRCDFMFEFYQYPRLSAQLERTAQSSKKNNETPIPPKPENTEFRPRRSELLHINLPNLREPLLLYASKEDNQMIFDEIREFERVPQVFKNCNTAAQEAYLKEHQEYIDSLKNFQTTGRVDIRPMIKKHSRTK